MEKNKGENKYSKIHVDINRCKRNEIFKPPISPGLASSAMTRTPVSIASNPFKM